MSKIPTTVETFLLGTAVKITTVLNIATATSVKISIQDPALATKINEVSMTKTADYVYTYVYQTDSEALEGVWLVTIKAVYSSYTAISQYLFKLEEQE